MSIIKCPISTLIMCQPVLASDGFFYEKDSIQRCIDIYGYISPITRLPIKRDFYKCRELEKYISQYLERHPNKKHKQHIVSTEYVDNIETVNACIENSQFNRLLEYSNYVLSHMLSDNYMQYDMEYVPVTSYLELFVRRCKDQKVYDHIFENIHMESLSVKHRIFDILLKSNSICGIKSLLEKNVDIKSYVLSAKIDLSLEQYHWNPKIEWFKLLIDIGMDISNNRIMFRLIEHAYTNKKTDIIKLLINYSDNVNTEYGNKMTHIHYACKYGNTEILKILIDNKADINATTSGGMTAIHYACENNDTNMVKLLVNSGADVMIYCNNFMVKSRQLNELIYYYMKTDYFTLKKVNMLPLDYAIINNNTVMFKLLVEAGADIDDFDQNSRISIIANNNNLDMIRLLAYKDSNLIHYAIKHNKINLIKLLIEVGINFNEITIDGIKPIEYAIKNGHDDTVALLYTTYPGLYQNLIIDDLEPICYAFKHNNLNMIKMFIGICDNLDRICIDSMSPLQYLCKNGTIETIRYFVEYMRNKGVEYDNLPDDENKTLVDLIDRNKRVNKNEVIDCIGCFQIVCRSRNRRHNKRRQRI